MIRRFRKSQKGGALVEFAASALLFFTVFFTAIEWSLELYVRHATERALSASLWVYAQENDLDKARATTMQETSWILSTCLEPIEAQLYNTIQGVDMSQPGSGYARTGTAADDGATFARLRVTCTWPRFTPIMAALMGNEMSHSVTGFAKLRWQP
jgi:Flp pilus assembly protein TadG